ncbi:hypothetical protein MAE02_68990 [Microvirga aerophila]|uniref:Uncharacterized protein n=1 Tax=Microvirga aerophila TaxID=670291 RepID=A0A512C4P0_9HYPH|nr:hypothetical protein MAE02_68990 [Microvirga aerophila]
MQTVVRGLECEYHKKFPSHPDCQSTNQNWLPQPLLYMHARLLI